jgi:hypothetical protein
MCGDFYLGYEKMMVFITQPLFGEEFKDISRLYGKKLSRRYFLNIITTNGKQCT